MGSSIYFIGTYYQDLSYLTRYLVRNRQLPPGTMFNTFRERDFQRRKAEGFPSSLYPSKIPTPQATPEPQKQRERLWRDQEYRNYSTNMDKRKMCPPAQNWKKQLEIA